MNLPEVSVAAYWNTVVSIQSDAVVIRVFDVEFQLKLCVYINIFIMKEFLLSIFLRTD